MHLDERTVGDCRILMAATPSSLGGFTAAVCVRRRGPGVVSEEIFCDLMLADGFRFVDARAALNYAFDIGYRQVRQTITGL